MNSFILTTCYETAVAHEFDVSHLQICLCVSSVAKAVGEQRNAGVLSFLAQLWQPCLQLLCTQASLAGAGQSFPWLLNQELEK